LHVKPHAVPSHVATPFAGTVHAAQELEPHDEVLLLDKQRPLQS